MSPMVSSEESVEFWDDVRNRFDDLLKRPVERYLWHRDIGARYESGRLSVHLHFTSLDGGKKVGWCLDCHSKTDQLGSNKHGFATPVVEPELCSPNDCGGQNRHPVLVVVHQPHGASEATDRH